MRWPLVWILAFLIGVTGPGCRSKTNGVENALRLTEESLRESREELQKQSVYTSALEHELRIIRGEVYAGQPGKPVAVFPVRSVVLGRQTGGHDSLNGTGDDGLQVIIEPQNADGRPIQVPGDAMLQVLEVTQEGHKRLLSSWYVDKDQIKASWKMGLLSQGYNLILPWKVIPTTDKLRLLLQFRLEDGRVFEADRDITVRLPKGAAARSSVPVVVSEPKPTLPDPKTTPELPAPKPELPTPKPEVPTPPERPMPPPENGTPLPPPPNLLPPPSNVPDPGSKPPEPTPPASLPAPRTQDGPSLEADSRVDPLVTPATVELGRPRYND